MHINVVDVFPDRSQRFWQTLLQSSWADNSHCGIIEQSAFQRVNVARPDQADAVVSDRRKSSYCRGELSPATACQDGDGCAIEKSAGRGFRGVEIGVGIEPRNARDGSSETGECADCGVAVA